MYKCILLQRLKHNVLFAMPILVLHTVLRAKLQYMYLYTMLYRILNKQSYMYVPLYKLVLLHVCFCAKLVNFMKVDFEVL